MANAFPSSMRKKKIEVDKPRPKGSKRFRLTQMAADGLFPFNPGEFEHLLINSSRRRWIIVRLSSVSFTRISNRPVLTKRKVESEPLTLLQTPRGRPQIQRMR
jgi:hypothetical protein